MFTKKSTYVLRYAHFSHQVMQLRLKGLKLSDDQVAIVALKVTAAAYVPFFLDISPQYVDLKLWKSRTSVNCILNVGYRKP